MLEHEVLDGFGELMIAARDIAIDHHDWAVAGSSQATGYNARHAALANLTDAQRAVVREEVIAAVDDLLHEILFIFEQADRLAYDVVRRREGEAWPEPNSVSQLSDGLGGEPYSPDGWIARYSRHQ